MNRLDQLVQRAAQRWPERVALWQGSQHWTFAELERQVQAWAEWLQPQLDWDDRVALYASKSLDWVAAFFAVIRVGAVVIPINPQLKTAQVLAIVQDAQARLLLTQAQREQALAGRCPCPCLRLEPPSPACQYRAAETRIDQDMAAILYTSGSTGQPKGVVLSQRNLLVGTESVAEYLQLTEADHLLALLPFSFDYGLNQLLTALWVGAQLTLMEYLLPGDVLKTLQRQQITGLAAVPPLWSQLARLDWPAGLALRYLTNSGGALVPALAQTLADKAPNARLFLMYGLTEAFRSTYLPPEQRAVRPTSIGKAIPNAEILLLNAAGERCQPHEVGELVHRGALVALGYWQAPELTAQRFRPLPRPHGLGTELAVFSGDQAYCDDEGYLYFVGRRDEQIKSSGYRISPTELEQVASQLPGVDEVVAFGVDDLELGQAIVLCWAGSADETALQAFLKAELPVFQWPRYWQQRAQLPRTPNNKFDRTRLKHEFQSGISAEGEP